MLLLLNELIDKLYENSILFAKEYQILIENRSSCAEYLFERALIARDKAYGKKIFVRGLIEFTNYCKNDCFY